LGRTKAELEKVHKVLKTGTEKTKEKDLKLKASEADL